jgi:hypothetical protein
MGVGVMGMGVGLMMVMNVVRHAGLRQVEWREYSTTTESGITRDRHSRRYYLFTRKSEFGRTRVINDGQAGRISCQTWACVSVTV